MEKQRELIQKLEEQQNDTEHRLDSCSKEEEEHLLEQHQQQTDSIEHQQKIFDDMEFKQLEVHIFASRALQYLLKICNKGTSIFGEMDFEAFYFIIKITWGKI